MRKVIILLVSVCLGIQVSATDILVETESFADKGGWALDQQFMDLMGSPYLLAHGMGVPVEDATTTVTVPADGQYRLFVRTYNWTAPWTTAKPGPGKFQVKIGDSFVTETLGCEGDRWYWQPAGTVTLKKGATRISLHDLTGFDGRCDALLLTTDKKKDPNKMDTSETWRRGLLKLSAGSEKKFDFVVIGGGIAGMCAAATAARGGCKVALVNDRFVLGGNNSSEVRVHLGGIIEMGQYPRIGRMIREFGHTRGGNAMPGDYYEDMKKDSFIVSEQNITLFAGYRAIAVKTNGKRIESVTIEHTETGERMVLGAPVFSDCTGDGTIGALAGADFVMGREAVHEYGESMAQPVADSIVMGASLQWYSKKNTVATPFPEFAYGMEFNAEKAEYVTKGEWTWETGMNRNQITEAERIRDYGLLVVYSNWSFLKNHADQKERYENWQLEWLGYVLGKRESRRLLGDYVLTQLDIDNNTRHEDASFCTTWAIDLHFPDPKNTRLFPGNEFKSRTVHNWIYPYDVPYRCLYSRNIDNLFMAGRNISCTHVALGTVRVMRTTGMMGEVVGMAATLCKEHGTTPRGVYRDHLTELKALMQKGAGRENVPDNQRYNEPNELLKEPKALLQLQGYAVLTGDTLRMGNSAMERVFLWNGGELKTITLTDKTAGKTLTARGEQPDMLIVKGSVTDGKLETEKVPGSAITPAHLLVTVRYRKGELNIMRQYRIYNDVATIACDTYLSGSLPMVEKSADVSAADRKNIESAADMNAGVKIPVLDRLELSGKHWQTKTVEFLDYTDWNDNLVVERSFIPYREAAYRGNLLIARDGATTGGFFILKEAPCSSTQLHYLGYDFRMEFGTFKTTGFGIAAKDVTSDGWTKAYTVVTGLFDGGEKEALLRLREYQKTVRHQLRHEDEMVMMNTWGDRSQDSRINNDFCLAELDRAARLGVTVFQLDDGWQVGKSPNSKVAKGSFKDIWSNKDYWRPDPVKFPQGLTEIVEKGRRLGIRIGLWYNPSTQDDFADWQKDAEAMLSLWREYGIRIFKIDGLQIPNKRAEERLRNLFDRVQRESNYEVMFNLDATAGRRAGYHMMTEYGNVFLENRYTDWGNYYPYRTLRNLWQLARYVPAERLQVEFLNKWRNSDQYVADDPFAPSNYSFDYLFAITMAAQPLAWMEAGNLPEEAYQTGTLIKKYTAVQAELHSGTILPIGEEPSGRSWTGFQSVVSRDKGFLLVFREKNDSAHTTMNTWLEAGRTVALTPVLGEGMAATVTVGEDGRMPLSLDHQNSFALYRYEVK